MKTLYFEGAGMSFYDEAAKQSDVGNFLIRTSFINLDGKAIYLEMGRTNRWGYKSKRSKKKTIVSEWALHIDYVHEVTGDPAIDDCNDSRISYDRENVNANYLYSKADITRWINENLNCDFETIEVLDDFYGYRVHNSVGGYNLMEDIELNHDRAKARRAAYEQIDAEYRQATGSKYSVITRVAMDDASLTIRCHASDQVMARTELPRDRRIEVAY